MSSDDKAAKQRANRERMLCAMRDAVIRRAAERRSWLEKVSIMDPAAWFSTADGRAELRELVALEAAADAFVHLVAEWQRSDNPPGWLVTIVKQAMATFARELGAPAPPVESVDSGENPREQD
jgi:hypothetical protein